MTTEATEPSWLSGVVEKLQLALAVLRAGETTHAEQLLGAALGVLVEVKQSPAACSVALAYGELVRRMPPSSPSEASEYQALLGALALAQLLGADTARLRPSAEDCGRMLGIIRPRCCGRWSGPGSEHNGQCENDGPGPIGSVDEL